MRFRGGRNSAGGASSAGPWIPVHAQGQRGEAKLQKPSSKHHDENTKNQAPNTKQIPSSKSQFCPRRRRIGACDLKLFWCLELGVWCLNLGIWCFVDSSLRMNGMVSKLNPSLKVDPPKTKTPSVFRGRGFVFLNAIRTCR